LCKRMVSYVNFDKVEVVIELGGGDGVITKHILQNMRPDAKLIVFELLPELAAILNEINDDRLIVVNDSAEKIKEYLDVNNLGKADAVFSGLPFVNIPKPIGYSIVEACRDNMKKGSFYVQFHYSTLVSNMYREVFGNLRYGFVAMNIPPVFIHICTKE